MFFFDLILVEMIVPQPPKTRSNSACDVSVGMFRTNRFESKHFFMFY